MKIKIYNRWKYGTKNFNVSYKVIITDCLQHIIQLNLWKFYIKLSHINGLYGSIEIGVNKIMIQLTAGWLRT